MDDGAYLAANPAAVKDRHHFALALRYHLTQGPKTHRLNHDHELTQAEIIRRAAAAAAKWDRQRVSDWFLGKSVPKQGDLLVLLRILFYGQARSQEISPDWLAAAGRARSSNVSRRIYEWDPFALDVHRPITLGRTQAPSAATLAAVLPTYVPRAHDDQLEQQLDQAAAGRRARLVILVGGSSTGKTRACYEAVKRVLPHWGVLFPADGPKLIDLLQEGVPSRTVLWLTELQNYLAHQDAAAALLARIEADGASDGPMVILGSMWQEHWDGFVGTDEQRADRTRAEKHAPVAERLLTTLSNRIEVPPGFEDARDRRRLEQAAATDPVLQHALVTAGDEFEVVQVLAGGVAAVERYQLFATSTGADRPRCRAAAAIITAAIDLSRSGAAALLTHSVLEQAAGAYLSRADRVQPDGWFPLALELLSQRRRGVAAVSELRADIGPGPANQLRLHDYLLQWGRQRRAWEPILETVWQAIVDGPDQVEPASITAALNRGRYDIAGALLKRTLVGAPTAESVAFPWTDPSHIRALNVLAQAGDRTASQLLVDELGRRGDENALQTLASAGNQIAAARLAFSMAQRGDEVGLQALANGGNHQAPGSLAVLAARRGDEAALRDLFDAGSDQAAELLANMLTDNGDEAGLRALAKAGNSWAVDQLALITAGRGDEAGLKALADGGNDRAEDLLADLLMRRGDEAALRAMVEDGSWFAWTRLADLLAVEGDEVGLRAIVQVGNEQNLDRLAVAITDDLPAQRVIYEVGTGRVAALLADVVKRRGDEHGLRVLADGGNDRTAEPLEDLLTENEDEAGLRALVEAGDTTARIRLVDLLTENGDEAGLRALVEAGDTTARIRLVHLLAKNGDEVGLRALAEAGHSPAVDELAHLLLVKRDLPRLWELVHLGFSWRPANALLDLLGAPNDGSVSLTSAYWFQERKS